MREWAITSFHLLRPWWLLALVPVLAIFFLLRRRQSVQAQWGAVIAPHLLPHLIARPDHGRNVNPLYLVLSGMAIGIVALSGPSWRRELPPFVEDKAPLMIALAVGSTMTETDVAPSRLERAKQKIRDLLAARIGARTGLIAYSGTAHLVMPLTDDRSVIEPFLEALSPALMPSDGKNLGAALKLATVSLSTETVAGTVLVVGDDPGTDGFEAIRRNAGPRDLAILAIGPFSSMWGAHDIVPVSVDGSDILRLERRIETRFQAAQGDRFGTRWRDEGFWLLPLLVALVLIWFRRGTTVAWALALAIASQAGSAKADEGRMHFIDLLLTPDQRGRLAFDKGDFAAAAKLFSDPMWRGIAAYRTFDFLTAAEEFARVDTIEGKFALGNAQAQNHAFEKAIKAYDEVLKAQPNNTPAKANRAIVQAALAAQEAKRRKQEQEDNAPPDLKADETPVDPDQKGGKIIKVTPQDVTTPRAAEAWMRQVQTTPGDFLKLKFAIQAAAPPQSGATP